MNWIRYINESLFPKPKYVTIERKIVARHMTLDRVCCDCQTTSSRLRTERSLRNGTYLTKKDIDRMRKKELSYLF